MPVKYFAFKVLDSLHVSYFLNASCSHDRAVDSLTCHSTSLVLYLSVFFLCVSACLAAEPETSEEEGTMPPFSLDPDTRTLSVLNHGLFCLDNAVCFIRILCFFILDPHTHICHSFYGLILYLSHIFFF